MFAGMERFLPWVYMRIFLPGPISPGTIYKVRIVSSRQSGTECLYDKNCPALAGIPVERTGIPLCWDVTKNVPAKFFPYKRNGTNKRYIHAWRDPLNVPSRQTSRPGKSSIGDFPYVARASFFKGTGGALGGLQSKYNGR